MAYLEYALRIYTHVDFRTQIYDLPQYVRFSGDKG